MGGGLLQLSAYGAQDIYLTGNPQITFFKSVYRRHTNFSIESIEQSIDGNVKLGGKIVCKLSRQGDLVGKTYIQLESGAISYNQNRITNDKNVLSDIIGSNSINCLFKRIELLIGEQIIDKHYGHWLTVYSQLTQTHSNNPTFKYSGGLTKQNYPEKMGGYFGNIRNEPIRFSKYVYNHNDGQSKINYTNNDFSHYWIKGISKYLTGGGSRYSRMTGNDSGFILNKGSHLLNSESINIKVDQISVKATTTDYLGFIGEEKGIGAIASVLILREKK